MNKTKSVISSPPLIIEEDGVIVNMHSGLDNFEIQAEQMRPSPSEPKGEKGKMVRQKRKSMAFQTWPLSVTPALHWLKEVSTAAQGSALALRGSAR
jgi:hypothetical protein